MACRGSARSGASSSRRDVSSVNSSAVDVRVSEVEVEALEVEASVDDGVGGGSGRRRFGENTGGEVEVGYEMNVEVKREVCVVRGACAPLEEGDASDPSSSFQCHQETCYTTNAPVSSFASINDANYQLKFLIPNALSGCIIGKKGANLERIQAASGAFIQANAPGYAVQSHRQRFIIIAGASMERCLHGLALLLQSVEDADKVHLLRINGPGDDPRLYLRQVIPGSCAGNIIGMKGGNVAKISRERGLSVFVEPKPLHAAKVPFRVVSYAGTSVDQLVGGVRGVIDELQRVDADMEQYMAGIKEIKSVVVKVVRVPSGRVGALIGPKGSHLHALEEVLKCRLSIGKSTDIGADGDGGMDHYYLTVWGQPENVRAAVAVAKLQGGHEVRRKFKESKESS